MAWTQTTRSCCVCGSASTLPSAWRITPGISFSDGSDGLVVLGILIAQFLANVTCCDCDYTGAMLMMMPFFLMPAILLYPKINRIPFVPKFMPWMKLWFAAAPRLNRSFLSGIIVTSRVQGFDLEGLTLKLHLRLSDLNRSLRSLVCFTMVW